MNNEQMMKEILLSTKTIASVGLSSNPEKVSHSVGAYLQKQGYRVIPVNPTAEEILGEKAYPNLEAVPENIQLKRHIFGELGEICSPDAILATNTSTLDKAWIPEN